jgi:hypothetical protein
MTNTDAPKNKRNNKSLNYFIYLPRIQKIAEPAPTIKSNGIPRQNIAKYC